MKYFSELPKKQFPGQSGCAVNKADMTGRTVATSGLAGLWWWHSGIQHNWGKLGELLVRGVYIRSSPPPPPPPQLVFYKFWSYILLEKLTRDRHDPTPGRQAIGRRNGADEGIIISGDPDWLKTLKIFQCLQKAKIFQELSCSKWNLSRRGSYERVGGIQFWVLC